MNILIVNTFYYPNMVGGTEHSVKLLAEQLVKRGHSVAVYSIDTNLKKEITFINGVKIYRLKAGFFDIESRMGSKNKKINKLLNKIIEIKNISIKKDIEFLIDDFKPNVIHTNNIYGISPYIWDIAKENKIKLIHTLRDYWLLSPNICFDNSDKRNLIKIYRKYFRKCSNNIDIVTAPSRFTLETFKELNYFKNSNFIHINNAIEVNYEKTKEILEKRKNKIDNVIRFIFVGALDKKKGFDKLIRIFSQNTNKNIRLTVCGIGMFKELAIKASNSDSRISYKGQLNKKNLEIEFMNNDVLIIPSVWEEPFGRVVIEANKYGLPVIGSKKGGIKEILENVKTGRLFESEEELEDLINYFSERNNIKKYFDNIEKNIMIYSVETQIEKFENIYDDN